MGKPSSCWNCCYRIPAEPGMYEGTCGFDGHNFHDGWSKYFERDRDCPMDKRDEDLKGTHEHGTDN